MIEWYYQPLVNFGLCILLLKFSEKIYKKKQKVVSLVYLAAKVYDCKVLSIYLLHCIKD